MDTEILNKDVAKEVLTILYYSGEYIQNRVPKDFINKLTDLAADSEIEVHLEKDIPLNEQNISQDALDTFALIYYLYVSNEEEKQELLSHWVINERE